MGRKITLTIAQAVVLISISLVSFESSIKGQAERQKFRSDTGFVTLSPQQVLRVTVGWDLNNDGVFTDSSAIVGIGQIDYVQANCSAGGMCKHASANPNPVVEREQLQALEALSRDIKQMPGSSGVRGVIVSNRADLRLVFQIINTSTGDIVAIWVPQGSPVIGK